MTGNYPVPAMVEELDADHTPEYDFWPDGATVGHVRDPFVDCGYCYDLVRRLNSRLVEESLAK